MKKHKENILPAYLFLVALLKQRKLLRSIKKDYAKQRKQLFRSYKLGETSALEDLQDLQGDIEEVQKSEKYIKMELTPFCN